MAAGMTATADTLTVEGPLSDGCSEPDFKIGDKFHSFEALERKIKQYERKHYVKLWKRDSKTVETAQKRLDRVLCKSIKYYSLIYSCIHGDKRFKPRGEGIRNTDFLKGLQI
uniref:ZSWIM3 N-terminal domain-containing protein n=1 Tax=Amphimedon queenslandica TaxID=400682 RepID=A0A1X7TWQ7_AMPQE